MVQQAPVVIPSPWGDPDPIPDGGSDHPASTDSGPWRETPPVPGKVEERFTEMEHALHPQPKLADGRGIPRLAVDTEGSECPGVAGVELPVVEEPEARPVQERMCGIREAGMVGENKVPRLGIICVLNQFLEDRETIVIPVPQVIGDEIDVVGRVAVHIPCLRGDKAERRTTNSLLVVRERTHLGSVLDADMITYNSLIIAIFLIG